MNVHDMKLEFDDGQEVHITFSSEIDVRHAVLALETFRLEILRSVGMPRFVPVCERV